jgi:hypothetical protein
MQAVTAADEWCAVAYMETDYTKLPQADFERVVRNYAIYRLLGNQSATPAEADDDEAGE